MDSEFDGVCWNLELKLLELLVLLFLLILNELPEPNLNFLGEVIKSLLKSLLSLLAVACGNLKLLEFTLLFLEMPLLLLLGTV